MLSSEARLELERAGLPNDVVARIRIRDTEEMDATEFMSRITFSEKFWRDLDLVERRTVIERLARPHTALSVFTCVIALVLLANGSLWLQSWSKSFLFAESGKYEATFYTDLIFRIPTILLILWVINSILKAILFYGDRKTVESGVSPELLISVLEKCEPNTTRFERIARLRSAQSIPVSG